MSKEYERQLEATIIKMMLKETLKEMGKDKNTDIVDNYLAFTPRGRGYGKNIAYLKECLEKMNDKPIFYISRSYGNKYIVPEEYFNNLTTERDTYKRVLNILKSKKYIPLNRLNPRFWNDKETYDETVNYKYYLWLCENECEYVVKEERKLTENEFNSIIEMLNNEKEAGGY